MTYDFFASFPDQVSLLEFIFKVMKLHIYDLYSEYGKEITEYKNLSAIAEKLKTEQIESNFQLWSPQFGGAVAFRRVELDPKLCNGHTFRYATEGLGLIQLYLGGQSSASVHKSHFGHFSEKSAIKWEDRYEYKAKQWNWKEIETASGKLKYYIRKQSIAKKHNCDVLPGAAEF